MQMLVDYVPVNVVQQADPVNQPATEVPLSAAGRNMDVPLVCVKTYSSSMTCC